MPVYQGPSAGGAVGRAGETRLAKSRLDILDPNMIVLMRDLFAYSDGMDSFSMPGSSTGGSGGGASYDSTRYLMSGSDSLPGTASLHSLVTGSAASGGLGASGSVFWDAGTGFYGAGGGGAGGNGGVILLTAKNLTIASSARLKANGGNGGNGGNPYGTGATNNSGAGGGGAGGAGGVIIVMSSIPSASAGFGLSVIELNGGNGGAGGAASHLTSAGQAGQAGSRTNPGGVFYIVI